MLKKNSNKTALLIGSKPQNVPTFEISNKSFAPEFDLNSEKLFSEMKELFKDLDPSIFEGHKNPNTGSNIMYDNKKDTYYITTLLDVFNPKSYVKNLEDLHNAFKEIHISKRDNLNFEA